MKITVLGFSCGIDSIDAANTSILVQTEKTSVLVDVSGSPRMELLRAGADLLFLDAILLTHGHIDHIYAFPSLIHSMWLLKRTKPLTVAGNSISIERCRHFFEYLGMDKKVSFNVSWKLLPVDRIGDISVETFSLFHRPKMPVNGFTFSADGKKVSFFPDCVSSEPFADCVNNSNLLIHEAGGLDIDSEEINKSHSTAKQAAQAALRTNAGKLVLVHLPEEPELRQKILSEARSVFAETELPVSGQVYTC